MSTILYVETNFLMSFATGRDQATDDLILRLQDLSFRLALPSVCYMEIFTTLERLKQHHEGFLADFRTRINDVDRGVIWTDRESRLLTLKESFKEVNATFDRFQERLSLAIESLSQGPNVETIEVTADILRSTLHNRLIRDTTDNLILSIIIEHAKARPSETKALLSENHKDFHDNQEAARALREAGVRYFRDGSVCLQWLRSFGPTSTPDKNA